MIATLHWLDRKTYLMVLLFLFWTIFWGLNGLDKVFNGASGPNTAPWSAEAVLVDPNTGEVALRLHPIVQSGFFGVTRDRKWVDYFDRIGMGKGIALVSLYVLYQGSLIVTLGISCREEQIQAVQRVSSMGSQWAGVRCGSMP